MAQAPVHVLGAFGVQAVGPVGSIAIVRGTKIRAGWIVLPDGSQVGSAESNPDAAPPLVTPAPKLDPTTGTSQDGNMVLVATLISGVTGSGF